MESKKRKRDDRTKDDYDDPHLPRITFHAVHKSFDRLFKEESLKDTKELVRRKLKLASDVDVGLEQWREGRLIDLEDDEDFAAFGALARTVPSLEVRVTVDGEGPSMHTYTSAPTKKPKRRSSSVPPNISAGRSSGGLPPPISQRQSTEEPQLTRKQQIESKFKKRRQSISSPIADLQPSHPEPTASSSLLTIIKSKSLKRKLPPDDTPELESEPVAKTGPSTETPVEPHASASGEPSTKKQKTNAGATKGMTTATTTKPRAQAEEQTKTTRKEKETEMNVVTGSGADQITRGGDAVKGKKDNKEKRKPNGKKGGEVSREDAEHLGAGADLDVDPSTKPKTKKAKAKAKKADISAEHDADAAPLRKLSAPTLIWLASLDKERELERRNRNGDGSGPVASTSMLPSPDISEPPTKKAKTKKSSTTASTEKMTVAVPIREEVAAAAGESSSMVVSKKGKAKSSKGKDKQVVLEEEKEHEQEKNRDAQRVFAENLAGVISKANVQTLPSDDGEEPIDVDANDGIKSKSTKKKKRSKKDLDAAAEPATALDLGEVVSKQKKRRRNTWNEEDADKSVANDEVKKIKAKSRSKLEESSAPMDEDEVTPALSDVKKTKGRVPPPVVSANTEERAAKIKTVTQNVPARNGPTGHAPSSSAAIPLQPNAAVLTRGQTKTPTASEAETYPPGKRQRSKSKLRMSWAPEAFGEEEGESSTVAAAHVEPQTPVAPLLPSSSPTRRSLTSSVPSASKKSPTGKKRRDPDEQPCPVCLKTPFHLRYRCPVIGAGPDAIEKRLEQLKAEDTGHRTLLIEELEIVIRNHRARAALSMTGSSSSPGSFAKSAANLSPMISTTSPVAKPSDGGSSARKPTIPSGSRMSEVTVENKDEGSSNEGSDSESPDDEDSDEDSLSEKKSNIYKLPSPFAGASSLADVDLDALIRGPASQSKSVLDDIPSQSASEDEDIEDVALDEDDEDDRRYRLLSKKLEKSAPSDDDEGEDPSAPTSGDSREDSGDEEMKDIPPKPSASTPQSLEDSSGIAQVVDGSNGSVGANDDDDEDRTEVAPSAENSYETDESGLSIRKPKRLQLTSKDVVPQPGSPIEEIYPPEGVMDIIEPIQPSAEGQKHNDLSDPIEPADDLMSTPRGEPAVENGNQNRASSQSPRKPGLAKRMKTQNGKVPSSEVVDIEETNLQVPTLLRTVGTKTRSVERSPSLGSGTRDKTSRRTDVESSSSTDVVPPPPVPAVKEQPRRGRRPLSEEVKAAREQAKADVKAQKAEERAQKEAAKQAEKKEKARQRAEKHQAKKTDLPKSTSQPRTEYPAKLSTPTSTPRGPDPPHSLDKWTTINHGSSPRVLDTSSVMLDQLRSSSPGHPSSAADDVLPEGTNKQPTALSPHPDDDQSHSGDGVIQGNPLFLFSSSLVPFPYSQWQGGSIAAQAEDTPTESEAEDEVLIKPKKTHHIPSSIVPKFRKLTDIASQAMFSQDILSPTPFPPTSVISDKPKDLPNDEDDEEDDEDDDSGSDSDTQGKSHIPKSRRAGATLRSKKGGLLSFA